MMKLKQLVHEFGSTLFFIFLFLIYNGIALLFFSSGPSNNLYQYTILIAQIFFLLTLLQILSINYVLKTIILLNLIFGMILSIWGILEYYNYLDPILTNPEFGSRVLTVFSNPNHYSAYLNTSFLLIVAYYLSLRSKILKSILFILLNLMFLNIIYTETRGVWISLSLASVLFSITCYYFHHIAFKNNKYWIFGLVISFTIIFVVMSNDSIFKNENSNSALSRIKSSENILSPIKTKDFSIKERVFIWDITKSMIINNFTFGVGYGNYGTEFIKTRNELYKTDSFLEKYPPTIYKNLKKYAHNEYLHNLAETGFIGFCLFVLITGSAIYKIKFLKYVTLKNRTLYYLAFYCTLVSILIHSIVSYPINLFPSSWNFWAAILLINTIGKPDKV